MAARVPFIPSLDVERDTAHPRLWAIVLTGDASPAAAVRGPHGVRGRRWPRTGCAGGPPVRHAIEDVMRLVPAGRVLTVMTRGRAAAWSSELAELPHVHRVVQPDYRGGAAEMLLPLLRIARQDPSATVVVVPADHGVHHEARFLRYVARAVWAVALRPDLPILIGAHPHAPVTDGWIEPGAPVEGLENLSVCAVKRVVDAASPAERRRLFESSALVSTRIFVGRAATLLARGDQALPEVVEALEPLLEAFGTPEESLLREAVYECMPEADLGPLERAPGLAVLPLPDVVWRAPEREALELIAS